MSQASCLATALRALELGLSPLPVASDGSKRPAIRWKAFTTEAADRSTVESWFAHEPVGVGLACGFGRLELLEFDDHQVYLAFQSAAVNLGLGELLERVEAGYLEQTPGGGMHLLYRCDVVEGNRKLAERQIDKKTRKPLIETRGQGGFVVIAPSNGRVHPSGGAYVLERGSLEAIAEIAPDERQSLFDLARTFDEIEPPTEQPRGHTGATSGGDGVLVDFNARVTPEEILEPLGWVKAHSAGGVSYWRRPGKDFGWSASWGATKGFRVFTTSTILPAESCSLAFVYCSYHHSGDWRACVKDLAQKGYGPGPRAPSSKSGPGAEGVEVAEGVTDPHRLARTVLGPLRVSGLDALRVHRDEWFLWRGGVYVALSESGVSAQTTNEVKREFERVYLSELRAHEAAQREQSTS